MSQLEEIICLKLAIYVVFMDMRICTKEKLSYWRVGEQSTILHQAITIKKAFHLVAVKIGIINLKWNAQG
jgi:hypothetical protein